MQIILIAAMSINRVIGKDNKIPWHIPKDLRHFYTITKNHIVVMGNNTFNSLHRTPLKNRINVILTRNTDANTETSVFNIQDLNDLTHFKNYKKNIFIIGGESVYKLALEKLKVDKIYLTIINKEYAGDCYFPVLDVTKFKCVSTQKDKQNDLEFSFNNFEAIK